MPKLDFCAKGIIVAKTPELLKASSGIAMDRMAVLEPKMRQMLEDFQKQVQAGESKGK